MSGRTPTEAREGFLAPLRRALSCLTSAQLYVPGAKPAGEDEAIVLSESPLPLQSSVVSAGLALQLRHNFRVVRDERADPSWHVSTTAYAYRLDLLDGAELISWHWHPGTTGAPHVHVAVGPIPRRVHLPSGRVSIESVLRLLLADLGVKPTRPDYATVLGASEQSFLQHRRWSG